MGSYAILSGGVEVSNMSPVLSSGMQLQKPMYIMQEAPKPASQQVWVHAIPSSNSQALRPVANPTMLQAAPQAVPTVYSAAPRPLLAAQPQAQPNTFVSQAPGAMRLVQLPGGGIQVQQAQPQQQQQVVMAPVQQPQQLQPRQPGNEVVYVNVNGVLQQGVVQNGSVYLLSDSASAAGSNVMQLQAVPGQQAPMAVTVASRQPGISAAPVTVTNAAQVVQLPNGQFQQQQVQVAGQVLPGARLVPVSQAAVRPAQLPQMQAQQQHAQRTTMMVMQPNGAQPTFVQSSAPMGVVMMSGTRRAGMQQAAGAPAQQAQVQVPVSAQQLVARSPAAVPAAATTRPAGLQMPQAMQPVQFTNGAVMQQQQMRPAAAALNGLGVAGVTTAPNNQQASAQAFRPALAAGAKILVPSASVSASTASLGNKPPAAATAAGLQQGQVALSSNNGSGIGVSQAVMVPMSAMQQQQQQLVPGLNGEMSSPPVPPITPGVVMDAPAPAAPGGADGAANTNAGSTLLALLNGSSNGSPKNSDAGSGGDNSVVRMHAGSQSPSHGIIGSQRSSKDGMGASRSGTPAPAGSSPPRSQPGTPARSNSGGGLLATAAAATTSGSAHSNSNKGAVMRLVARSFIETGIALEQALTMIQPADKELLAAAFAAEAAGAPLPDSVPAAAAESAAANKINGVGGMIDGLGLGFGEGAKGGASTTDAMVAAPSSSNGSKGLFGGEGLSGLLNLSFADDVSCANDNNSINMGSWGFSLFTGSGISDLNGGAVGLSSLGPADPCLADVAAAPAAAQQPAGQAGKDSALAGMLASLNL